MAPKQAPLPVEEPEPVEVVAEVATTPEPSKKTFTKRPVPQASSQKPGALQDLYLKAEELYNKEEKNPQNSLHGSKKNDLLVKMLDKGTSKDRLSTTIVMIKDSPSTSLHLLEKVIRTCKGGNKKNAH